MMIHPLAIENRRNVVRYLLPTVLCVVLAGCGPGENLPEVVPVTGSVTYQGKPLEDATVMFLPEDKMAGNPAAAETNADGSFTMTTYEFGDGAIPGKHAVTVQLFDKPISIPGKYGSPESTPLEFTVETETPNHFDIMLVE